MPIWINATGAIGLVAIAVFVAWIIYGTITSLAKLIRPQKVKEEMEASNDRGD